MTPGLPPWLCAILRAPPAAASSLSVPILLESTTVSSESPLILNIVAMTGRGGAKAGEKEGRAQEREEKVARDYARLRFNPRTTAFSPQPPPPQLPSTSPPLPAFPSPSPSQSPSPQLPLPRSPLPSLSPPPQPPQGLPLEVLDLVEISRAVGLSPHGLLTQLFRNGGAVAEGGDGVARGVSMFAVAGSEGAGHTVQVADVPLLQVQRT